MPKDNQQIIEEFMKSKQWEKIARAFQEADIEWHTKEWKDFIKGIRDSQKESWRKEIEGMKKRCYEVPALCADTGCVVGEYNQALEDILKKL